jgi:radical SAM-linked protein
VTQPQAVYRQAIDFAVDGDIRFLAHRDMLRLFARAAVRARLPIRYSQGFNPHPRLSLPLPRPVAVASDAERLVIELTALVEPDQTLLRLQEQVPGGIRLTRAWALEAGERCRPVRVTYRVEVPVPDRRVVERRAAALMGPAPIHVKRTNPDSMRVTEVDLRPFIESLSVGDDRVEMTLRIVDGASARPAELVAALGLESDTINHRVRRLEVEWQ